MTTTHSITINIYRTAGEWYAARWIDGEYDGCDAIDCDSDASDAEAIECAKEMPLNVGGSREICRVNDM